MHILLHIVESVRHSGPLCATSAFCFESDLHVLKQNVLGSKKPEQQMGNKSLDILDYKFKTSRNIFHSEIARQYCQKIFSNSPLSTYITRTPYGVTFCGRGTRFQMIHPTNNEIVIGESFKKCIYKGIVYKSVQNTLSTRRNDTVFKLVSGEIVKIQNIVKSNPICYLLTVQLIVVPDVQVRHMFKVIRK